MLNSRALVRFKHYEQAAEREKQERARRQEEATQGEIALWQSLHHERNPKTFVTKISCLFINFAAITTTLTSFGTLVTDFWGWITNPADQQHVSTIEHNLTDYEPLDEHVKTMINANTTDSPNIGIEIEKDGGAHTLVLAGGGECETNSDHVLVARGVDLGDGDASGKRREGGDNDGDIDGDGEDGNISRMVGFGETEGARHRKGWNLGAVDAENLESPT
ncbi:hypothetical protein HDU76_005485 [Blyttiomyces sp. JEL0837]|nr:hypothetical protein HDU76_005485 [Blyttiomyces sp. JEL0837]